VSDHATLRRLRADGGDPVYVIGLGLGFFDVGLKSKLKELATDTGADAFFVGSAKELAPIYRRSRPNSGRSTSSRT